MNAATFTRRQFAMAGLGLLGASLAGCATVPPPAAPLSSTSWAGRLSLVLEKDEQPQNFIAAFRLQGNPHTGTLDLFSPLGSTLAQVRWNPALATVQQGKMAREYPSLDDLIVDLTGANVPVAALFDWLAGRATPVPGWTPDLTHLGEGRLSARRAQPLPVARLQVVLENENGAGN